MTVYPPRPRKNLRWTFPTLRILNLFAYFKRLPEPVGRMASACESCPFRRGAPKRFNRNGRRLVAAHCAVSGEAFVCHKTYGLQPGPLQCAGALVQVERVRELAEKKALRTELGMGRAG